MRRATVRCLTVLACAVSLACGARAQEVPGAVLPPPATVQEVLVQLPQVRAAGAGLALAQARGERLRAGPHDWVAKAGANQRREQGGTRYAETELGLETGMRWPGKVAADRQLGAAVEQVAVLAQADAWHEAARILLADWFEALRAARTDQLLQAQEALMARTLAATQRRVDLGEAATLELLATQAEHARVKAQAARAAAQAMLVRQSLLRRYPGLPDPASLLPPADAPWPAEVPEGGINGQDPAAAWVARILEDNHELELAEAQAGQTRLQAERMRLERTPDPTVGVRATRERGGQEHVLGVYVSLPLGSAGRRADAQAALAQADVAQQELARTRQRVEAEAWRVVGEAAQARATLAQQRQALAYSEKSAALQARAYALGESGLGDWLLAQRGALDARLAAETAALEAQQAQARVLLDAHRIWTPPGHGTPHAEH